MKTKYNNQNVLNEFLSMSIFSTDEVFNQFLTDTDGHMYEVDGHKFYFKPGTREDRILLVAHADTVWDLRYERMAKIAQEGKDIPQNRTIFSDSKEYFSDDYYGIGADDRAGAAMVWLLKDSGNSVLITDEEEIGALTSKAIMNNPDWKEVINSHKFILQFDMNGHREFKCYGAGSEIFKKMMERETNYKMRPNFSYTDVTFLGQEICGANLSIGYYNEHSEEESLNIQEWLKATKIAEKLAKAKHNRYLVEKDFGEKYALKEIDNENDQNIVREM